MFGKRRKKSKTQTTKATASPEMKVRSGIDLDKSKVTANVKKTPPDSSSGIKDFDYMYRPPVDTISDGWPVQSLFHGSVFGVAWNGGGVPENVNAPDIDAAVGINQEEAIAAMISGELLQDNHITSAAVHAIETFLVGFAHGLLGQMDEPDGIHQFQSALHRETFDSISSGIIFDYAKEEADILKRRSPSSFDMVSKQLKQREFEPQIDESHLLGKAPKSFPLENPLEQQMIDLNKLPKSNALGSTLPSPPPSPPPMAIEYSAPRYYEAKDPVLMLTNSRRSSRHGGDGIFEDDGRLKCRSTRGDRSPLLYDGIDRTGKYVMYEWWYRTVPIAPLHRSVPIDCQQLIWELEIISSRLQEWDFRNKFDKFVSGDPSSEWRVGDCSCYPAPGDSLPSPVGLNLWKHQAWVPIIADLRLTYTPYSGGWDMGVYDFELNSDSPPDVSPPIEFERRMPITHGTGRILADRLRGFLDEEAELDADNDGVLTPEQAEGIEAMINEYLHRDLISISLSSIDEAIDEVSADLAIRSGSLTVDDISVIDAFGQVIEFQASEVMNQVRVGLSLETPDDDNGVLLMKPRIPRGSRLNLRLLTHDEDTAEANSGSSALALDPDDDMIPPARSPVCGFFLPDHIEWAMEVFNQNGDAQGQLRVADRHWGHMGIQKGQLAWDSAPGSQSSVGSLPDTGNLHMDRLLNSLMDIGYTDDIERGIWDDVGEEDFSGENTGEGVLSALLRAIDTTNWYSDPYGKGGDEYPVFYMGRPVAVVRAVLRLEVSQATPMPENLRNHAFEVRLGAIQNRLDGLLGYFVNDDYTRFNTVYPIQNGAPDHPETSIDHEFLDFDPTLEVRPEQDVYLTLLMNPQSAVHVTSGILPQKEIVLLREHWQDAVAKIAPSFKVGPVLVDPTSVRMPIDDMKPNLIWKWTHRETPSEWIEGPIKRSDSKAGLPHGKMTAYEGWIKLDIDESQES